MPAGALIVFWQQQPRNCSPSLAKGLTLISKKQHGKVQPGAAPCGEQISHSQAHGTAQLVLGTPFPALTLHLMGWRPTLIRDRDVTLHYRAGADAG